MKIFLDANVCLDLLDTTRVNSEKSIKWYLKNKDNTELEFYFSADFITTIYYVLTQKKKYNPKDVIETIEKLSYEVIPCYLRHEDFLNAKSQFFDNVCNDFEDLLVLNSAFRLGCKKFITNDKELLKLKQFNQIKILPT